MSKELTTFVNSLEMREKITIYFKDKKYFKSTDGFREMRVGSKETIEERLGLSDSKLSDSYKQETFKQNDIEEITVISGRYVGSRHDIIKIMPSSRLFKDRESEYFILYEPQIQKIERSSGKASFEAKDS